MNPGVHHIIERDSGIHLAVREGVVLFLAPGNAFAFAVVESKTVRLFRRLREDRTSHGRIREIHRVNGRPIGRGGQQANGNK